MAGSRVVQENDVPKPGAGGGAGGAAAPSAPPLPFFVQRTAVAAPVEEESSGDEVCFNNRPLLAVAAAPRPREPAAPAAVSAVSAAADRGALARAKMQTLGCAKKDRKAPADATSQVEEVSRGTAEAPKITSMAKATEASEVEAKSAEDASDSSEGEADRGRRDGTWWAQFFQLKVQGVAVASLKVSLARLHLTDLDLLSLTAALERVLQDLRDEEPSAVSHRPPVRVLVDFDLSDNCISDSGAAWLFGWLMQRPQEVRCRVLRLARNRLGDASLEWLSALVCQQHSAIEELHLAENAITATGAAHLLLSFALHPFEAYPFLDPRGLFAPAAVCLDRNPIPEPGLLARLRLRSNLRAACKDGNLRTSNFNSTPHVQLGAAFPDEATRVSTVLPLALEKVCAGGTWPSLPQLPRPHVKEAAENEDAFDRQVPKGKTFRRELLVDEEEGAGVELETVTDGLQICQIMEIPGQPGLRVGDVIVAIDGLPLWWHACQHDQVDIEEDDDAPSARFRFRFRRGARLDILRQEAPSTAPPGPAGLGAARGRKRFACPICWDTFDLWNDCLEHLRDCKTMRSLKCVTSEFGHEPPRPEVSNLKLEDASGSLRRWMATCMAAARGELRPVKATARASANGVTAEQWMAVDEPEKAETLLLPASIGVLGERCRMAVEALAEEASRFGFEQGCTVWTLPNGLCARCPGAAKGHGVASIAEQLLQIMHFYLPDVDDKETLGEEDEELAEWTAWLEQMLQQAEETRQARQPKAISSTRPPEEPSLPNPPASPRLPELRLLLLCGLPGSGKSTLARSFAKSSKWCVVNQDTLGSRQACMKVARHALAERGHVVIDRCNVTRGQRGIWTLMASEFNLSPSQVGCVWLDVPDDDCSRRVLQRFGHRTLPPREASLMKVIRNFARQWQAPDATLEGFGRLWRLATDGDQEMFLADFGLNREPLPPQPTPPPKVGVPKVVPSEAPAPSAPEVQLPKVIPEPSMAQSAPAQRKVGSNKILTDRAPEKAPQEQLGHAISDQLVAPVTLELAPTGPGEAPLPDSGSLHAADVWTCDCGEINKRKRNVCNNCFAEQPRTNVLLPAVLPAVAPAVPNGDGNGDADAATEEAAVEEEVSEVEAPQENTGCGYADFWRLPMLEEDLSPPK